MAAQASVDYYHNRNVVDPSLEISIEDQAIKKLPKLILKKDNINFMPPADSRAAPSEPRLITKKTRSNMSVSICNPQGDPQTNTCLNEGLNQQTIEDRDSTLAKLSKHQFVEQAFRDPPLASPSRGQTYKTRTQTDERLGEEELLLQQKAGNSLRSSKSNFSNQFKFELKEPRAPKEQTALQ